MLGRLASAVGQFNRMRVDQFRTLVKGFDTVVLEDIAIDAFQPVEFGMQLAAELRPVESAWLNIPTSLAGARQGGLG